ncbi:MAG TPA: type IV pilin protein [Burkholderiaceae bacterium]|nr:type IV pilin protein [Burkholderiaceae bacterium]
MRAVDRARRRRLALAAGIVAFASAGYALHQDAVRARRFEAVSALVRTSLDVERYFERHGEYPRDIVALRGPGSADRAASGAASHYTLQLVSPNPATNARASYLLIATPTGGQIGDACGRYTFDERAHHANPDASVAAEACWPR